MVEQFNQTCQVCRSDPAVLLCSCSFPPSSLCASCFAKHQTNAPLLPHLTMPIAWLGREPEEYAESLGKLKQGKAELRYNLVLMKQCRLDFTQSANNLIEQLSQYRDSFVDWMEKEEQQLSTTVEKAITEAEGCLAQRSAPESSAAHALITLSSEKLRVFNYVFTPPDIASATVKWVTWENNSQSLNEPWTQQVSTREAISQAYSLPAIAASSSIPAWHSNIASLPASRLTLAPISDDPNPLGVTEAGKTEFHRPSEESWGRKIPEIPKTISRHRLPMQSLIAEFADNPGVTEQFQTIFQDFSTWRRSKKDANSFYRCFGLLLLEHYCRPDTFIHDFHTFGSQVLDCKENFAIPDERRPQIKPFVKMIRELYSMRTREGNALQSLQYALQRSFIDIGICQAMKTYVANYLFFHPLDQGMSRNIFFLGREADRMVSEVTETSAEVFKAAACCFSVVLHVFTQENGTNLLSETVYRPKRQGWLPSFAVLSRNGHFDCLVRKDMGEADQYDFEANTYTPHLTYTWSGYELISL